MLARHATPRHLRVHAIAPESVDVVCHTSLKGFYWGYVARSATHCCSAGVAAMFLAVSMFLLICWNLSFCMTAGPGGQAAITLLVFAVLCGVVLTNLPYARVARLRISVMSNAHFDTASRTVPS
jgi:hypothetical protein